MDIFVPEGCNKAAIAGLFRNDKGMIDIAFSIPIGDVPILVAECMASSTGVRLTRTKKIRNIEIESDTIQFVNVINEDKHCHRYILTLIQETLYEKKFCNNIFRYYNKKNNKVVDYLTNLFIIL